jgi:glycosyltransferase involved in cell wall biosynthesis
MKVSICIPQYNRIRFLLQSLETIAGQDYPELEVVISDDCSTDDTQERITSLIPGYRFPIVYHRNQQNLGYDANYRKCIELATGEYCLVIGNDDTLNGSDAVSFLVSFLKSNDHPEIGFSNFVEASDPSKITRRAETTAVLGSGYQVALKYYSCFSFVGGLIYKKSAFDKFNTSKHDGSIYAQMYLGCLMISSGCRLFSIERPLVIKDLEVEGKERKSYKDTLARTWKDYKVENGGLPSVIHVLISAFRDAGQLSQDVIYHIFKRIYTVTYPYWIVDYKNNGALPAAVGLVSGMRPARNNDFGLLSFGNKLKLRGYYSLASFAALCVPAGLFMKMKEKLYRFAKK